ncbi:hypothetical protein RND81_08G135200 [Saponaria officinalis]|uniref:Uncharacterized protein n=1 Tax=Saponaria officinalis TaxID=3572 RepID=A0AAW1J6B5_SAPOF
MADDIEDSYAFIIDNCLYSSSQEDFLRLSNFAREDDTFSGDVAGKSDPPAEFLARNVDVSVVGGYSGSLGFRGERNKSPKLKKVRFSEDVEGSPLVHCSGKVVIEGEIDASEVVFEGDVKVKVVKPLRCVALDGAEFSVGKLGFEDCGEGVEENQSKKESEFERGAEVMEAEYEENVGMKNEENFDTEVIEVGENGAKCEDGTNLDTEVIEVEEEEENGAKVEDVTILDTELIDVDEERGTSMNEEIPNVDTEVVGDYEEEKNHVTGYEIGVVDIDTSVIEFDEEGGVEERTSKNEEIGNVVTKEQGNCAKVDRETNDVDMEKIVVEEQEENRSENGKFGIEKEEVLREEGTKGRKRKLPRSMVEKWGEGCLKDVRMKVVGVDEEQGNCAKINGETSDVNMEENVGEKEENHDENGNCAKVNGETSDVNMEENVLKEKEENRDENGKCEIDEVDVLGDSGSRMSEEEMMGGKRKLLCSMFEQCVEDLRNVEGCSKDVRMKVVGGDEEQGNCTEINGETSDVSMEEIVVKEMDANRDENGKYEIDDKKGFKNGEGCSKDVRTEGNGKSKNGEAYIKGIWDALKFYVGEISNGGEVDFLETAKRRGMTFPRPRFRPSVEDDE